MKNFTFLVLTALALTLVACGNKESSGGGNKYSSSNPYKVYNEGGWVDAQQPRVKLDSKYYTISQQSYQVVNQAFYTAQQAGIPSKNVDGVNMFKSKLTFTIGQGYQQPGYQVPFPQQQGQLLSGTVGFINISSMQIVNP